MSPDPTKHQCQRCRKFLDAQGQRCKESTGLTMPACRRYKHGRCFTPQFCENAVKEIDFDPQTSTAWSFWTNDTSCLLLVWDVDHNQYGHFRAFLIGINDEGVVQKKFTQTRKVPAFFGEVCVKGLGDNDLWSSFGYEDDDLRDAEGNVTNKPREVKLLPRRED